MKKLRYSRITIEMALCTMKFNFVPILVGLSIINLSVALEASTTRSSEIHDDSSSASDSSAADEPQYLDGVGDESVPKSWIITHTQFGIENEYFYILREANSEGTTLKDEFSDKTRAELGSICSRFKNCKIYQQVDPLKTFPEPQKLEILPDEPNEAENEEKLFVYASRPLKSQFAGNSQTRINEISAFPCRTHKDRTYWLTYGFTDARIFMLKEVDDGAALQFVAQGEPVPHINDKYPRGKALEEYFYKVTPENAFLKSKMVKQNPFVESTRFRLCCVIHAAREKDDSFTLNYANRDYRTIFGLHQVQNDQINVKEKYSEIKIRALGCSVNLKDNIPFYLFGDHENSDAVFALELQSEKIGYEKKFVVTEHFRGLHLPVDSATAV